ncbi:hypothetical protein KGF57_004813 [Candida theae]|uniref:Dienelactone hydrolase domain-containing protein n=1 Tax=Candida theae TaxID=1198502 RepID=A0AAD5BAH4_9ASCO|nr:uncharacterized protein KGF57_004813 [Candida theae]KAI5949215.1 hypothetical protein KGF57_004813 [Candida theae]
MASNPPGQCCTEGTFHEGKPVGAFKEIFGLDTYTVGEESSDKIIVIVTDIFGNHFNNTLLIADTIAKSGYKVLIPDILKGDPVKEGDDLQAWLKKHTLEITEPIVDGFLSKVKSELKPKFLGSIGYCFGAKYVVRNLTGSGPLDAGAVAHPSFVAIEEVKAIKKPLIISAAETDQIFTPELRRETVDALSKLDGVRYEITLFSGTTHGFAVRGDTSDPIVKYAKEKALNDALYFFWSVGKIGSK